MRCQLLLILASAILLHPDLQADENFHPSFGHPFVYTDRIVFTSVDGTHLIGIDKIGRKRWERQFPERIYPQRFNNTSLLAQSGRRVFQIDLRSGAQALWATLPEFQFISADSEDSFLATSDSRIDHHRVRILDPVRHAVLWESSNIESITHITPGTVVAVTADRVVEDAFSYSLTNATLRGFDRLNGRLRWSVPLSDSQAPSVSAAASKGVLAFIDRLRISHGDGNYELLVLNPETGEILFRRKGEFRDLAAREGSLVVLEGTGPGDGQLYTCDLPACVKNPGLGLSAKEILSFQLYRDFVLTWGLYDAACFSRSTGERLWEKGQIEWTLPFENEMIAADYSSKSNTARIISIDLRTGAERVLFSRGLTEKDLKAFIPLSQ